MYLKGKNVLLAVTGGIAAYKVVEVLRQLTKAEAKVKVMMTKAAREFVGTITFETLSGEPVSTEVFPGGLFSATHHIDLADWADLILVAPATANIIAKINAGIADDLVSTTLLAAHSPVVIAPAMNTNMWNNPVTRRNISALEESGIIFVPTERGDLACGYTGEGRLAPWQDILQYCEYALAPKDYRGKKVLISAGPTAEDIDDVRFLTNRSSGKMGYRLAYEAFCRGAAVTLVSGPVSQTPPADIKLVKVRSAAQMMKAIEKEHKECDIFISAAAVADFTPKKKQSGKIKKGTEKILTLELEKTPDILRNISGQKGRKLHIGFALEAKDKTANALRKLKEKNLDAVVLNDAVAEDAGFEADTNRITFFYRSGGSIEFPLLSKRETAQKIFDSILTIGS
jgi:phosphopantothenoylcysteine decarboxylase/phosphopantothenate--cysteine ligase